MSKQPIETIEDTINKVEKEIKRNWKKIILITVIITVILSSVIFITGLRIRFAIYDNLIVYLSPSEKSFTIPNDKTQNITFDISVEDSMFCTANCSYALYDRSEDKIIDEGSMTARNKNYFNKTYVLMPYSTGSGQKVYNFDVQCSNIRSFLCTTKGLITRRSSFITLNYKLTEEEERIKTDLKPVIAKSFVLVNNASADLEKVRYILNATKGIIEYSYFNEAYSTIYNDLNVAIGWANKAFELWSKEEYLSLNSLYNVLINKSGWIYQTSENLLSELIGSINKQNILFLEYNEIKNGFFAVSKQREQYVYYSLQKDNITKGFNLTYDYLKFVQSKIFNNEYISISSLKGDLINASVTVDRFNKTLDNEYNLTILKGNVLSSFEYSKKCYLGYCENLTGDICFDLNAIFSEYAGNTYKLPANISISNISYYIESGGNVQILVSSASNEYYNNYCLGPVENISVFLTDIADIETLNIPDISNITTEEPIKNELTENPPMCCVYGECSACCQSEECRDDPKLFPVVLIHGHSLLRKTSPEPLLDSFNKVQYQLQEDEYMNAGIIRFDSIGNESIISMDLSTNNYEKNEWGLTKFPITVKASYYYDYFYSLGSYIYITRNRDNLDTYAIRLNNIIELVKYRTGKPKVNIIAHSMGGLVARRYIQVFGENSVDKLILIAAPNKGVRGDIKKFCNIFGEGRECEDMYDDSIFMKKINDPNYKLRKVKVYTISGIGCKTDGEDGDGVVTFEDSTLDYATSFVVNGTCEDAFKRGLHSDLLDIDKYPQVYDDIKDILEEAD